MPNYQTTAVLNTLSDMPGGSIVRVVVQGFAPLHSDAQTLPLNPKDYSSHMDYREALIEQRRSSSHASKAFVEREAQERGLKATPASVLNAVTVEGAPNQVADLLTSIEFETAVLERPMTLGTLSRPV